SLAGGRLRGKMHLGAFRLVGQNPRRQATLNRTVRVAFYRAPQKCYFLRSGGVGKSFFAQALGHAACRAGYRVLFSRADRLLKILARSRADNSFDRELRCFLTPDLLIVDDFALKKLSVHATSEFYDLLIERHTRSSTIITSDRSVEEWMAVFDELMLAQSALDRFCHRAHQFVLEGESYRKRTVPGSRWKNQPKSHDLNYRG